MREFQIGDSVSFFISENGQLESRGGRIVSHKSAYGGTKYLVESVASLGDFPADRLTVLAQGIVPKDGLNYIWLSKSELTLDQATIETKIAAETKPTNPKDAIGSDKIPLHLWPTTATVYGAMALLDGASKYGKMNYRGVGVRASIYIDALERHFFRWAAGENLDPDSGLPHLAHVLACAAILVDALEAGKLTDDREYPGGLLTLLERMTPHVKRIKEKYKDKAPHHYTIQDVK